MNSDNRHFVTLAHFTKSAHEVMFATVVSTSFYLIRMNSRKLLTLILSWA